MEGKKFIEKEEVKNIDVSEIGKMGKPETINKVFPNEEIAIAFMNIIRWGEFASCPFCRNFKAYYIENGKRFKCANPKCYKKFSVTTKTLMECTNIKKHKWVHGIYHYSKKRGRILSWELKSIMNISAKAAFFVKEKIDFAWKYVKRENVGFKEIFESLLKKMFEMYEQKKDIEQSKRSVSYYRLKIIDDISNFEQYDSMLLYADIKLHTIHWLHPRFIRFTSPQDVLANVYLHMEDKKIKEYDAKSMEVLIMRRINVMHYEYIQQDGILRVRHRDYLNEFKRLGRMNLQNWYVRESARYIKKYEGDLVSFDNPEEIKIRRKKMKEMRERLKRIFEWQSHFS